MNRCLNLIYSDYLLDRLERSSDLFSVMLFCVVQGYVHFYTDIVSYIAPSPFSQELQILWKSQKEDLDSYGCSLKIDSTI